MSLILTFRRALWTTQIGRFPGVDPTDTAEQRAYTLLVRVVVSQKNGYKYCIQYVVSCI